MSAVHLEKDNLTALSYLVKIGGTHAAKVLTSIAKEIWDFLFKKQSKIAAD